MQAKTKKRIGILRGGMGENYTTSLKKGGEIILHILENLSDKFKVIDILIDKDGVWHLSGIPILPAELVNKIDVAWNLAHPSLSLVLDDLAIPNIGGNSFSSGLEKSKEMLRDHMKNINVQMPRSMVIPVYQEDFDGKRERYAIKKAKEIHEKFGSPWIIKSFTPDANMAIHVAKTFGELVGAIEDGVKHGKSILVEEMILGKVGSLHSVPEFRNEPVYVLPFGKYSASFSGEEKEKLINFVKDLHGHVGAEHYLKSDLVLNPKGKIYLLGIESIPDLRQDSHFSEACESLGIKPHNIIEHILERA